MKTIVSFLSAILVISQAATAADAVQNVNAQSAVKICPATTSPATQAQTPSASEAQTKEEVKMLTALGQNYVQAIGYMTVTEMPHNTQGLGAAVALDFNFNAYKAQDDKYGADIFIPMDYTYLNAEGATIQDLEIPFMLRPYYVFEVNEDVEIAPYAEIGAGVKYSLFNDGEYNSDGASFLWATGCGVEVSFLKDFSIMPNFRYLRTEFGTHLDLYTVGAEFAWRFHKNFVAIIDYKHLIFDKALADYGEDRVGLGIRYNF